MNDEDDLGASGAADEYLASVPVASEGGGYKPPANLDDSDHPGAKDESSLDAILYRIMDESGVPSEEDEENDWPDGDDVQADADSGAGKDPLVGGQGDDSEAFADAYLALKEGGWTPSEIQALDRSDAIRLGSKLAQRQQGVSQGQEPSQDPGKPQAAAFDAKELQDKLTEDLGEDGAAAVAKTLSDALNQLVQAAQGDDRLQRIAKAVGGLQKGFMRREELAARERLQARFPSLTDDGVYSRVKGRMARLIKDDEYGDVEEVMQDACMIELPQDVASATVRDSSSQRQRAQRGQPMRQGRSKKSLSKEQAEDAVLRRILDPSNRQTPDQIRKEVYGG